MKRNTLKLLAFTCALAVTGFISSDAHAQAEDVPVTLGTSSAITVTAGDTMDFGTWLLLHPSAPATDDFTLVLDPVTAAVVSNAAGTSFAANITPSASVGSLTFSTPVSATVDIYGTVTDIASTALTLASPTFSLNGGATLPLSIVSGTPTAITSTGGTDTLRFGATITVTATPLDNAAHTGNLEVTFSY